jgi:hypothetical protein
VVLPVFPSLVAVMLLVPDATAVTNPLASIVATAGVPLDQVIVRPVSTLPLESRKVAVACVVWPAVIVDDPNCTVTVLTGTGGGLDTVTLACADWPSEVAVTVAPPAATARTSPVEETVATAVFVHVHVTVRPLKTFPRESLSVAVNWYVPPTASETEVAFNVTLATGRRHT